MAIEVTCESCFRDYRLKDQFAGKTIRCKECREPIQVPALGDDEIEDYGDFAEEDYGSSAPPQRRSFSDSSPSKGRKKTKKKSKSAPSRFPIKYQLLCSGGLIIAGVFLPKTSAIFALLWATIALGASIIGILWLAVNLFKSNPVDALIMILLPFVGFIGISRRVDFLNDENDRPYRWVIRGFLSMVLALFTAIFVKGVEENMRYSPSFFASNEKERPPNPNLRMNSPGPQPGSRSPAPGTGPRASPLNGPSSQNRSAGASGANSGSRSTPERQKPRSRVSNPYQELPGPTEEVIAKLDQRLREFPLFVPGTIEINETEKRIIYHVTERPTPDFFRQQSAILKEVGIVTGRGGGGSRPAPTQFADVVGNYSTGPSIFVYYNSLPQSPEESLALIQKTLQQKEYALADKAFIRTASKYITIRVKTKDDLQHRDELQELLKSAGIDVRE